MLEHVRTIMTSYKDVKSWDLKCECMCVCVCMSNKCNPRVHQSTILVISYLMCHQEHQYPIHQILLCPDITSHKCRMWHTYKYCHPDNLALLPSYHAVILSLVHPVIISPAHPVILSPAHPVIQSPVHPVIRPSCHPMFHHVHPADYHPTTLQSSTLPFCHPTILPHYILPPIFLHVSHLPSSPPAILQSSQPTILPSCHPVILHSCHSAILHDDMVCLTL